MAVALRMRKSRTNAIKKKSGARMTWNLNFANESNDILLRAVGVRQTSESSCVL